MTNEMNPSDAHRAFNAMIACDCFSRDAICRHDTLRYDSRLLLIDIDQPLDELESTIPALLIMRQLIAAMMRDRELATMLLLEQSLCPLHAIDYAICFDDDDPDCAAIRTIHPSHDT
jgi:hypothetical protein